MHDLDGDGSTDFLRFEHKSNALTARSGQDGHTLWEIHADHVPSDENRQILCPPLPHGDVNGDGVPDLIWFSREWSGHGPELLTVSARSGRNGAPLWTSSALGPTPDRWSRWQNALSPFLDWADLNGDGHAAIFAVHEDHEHHLQLTALVGRDGRKLWSVPVAETGFALHGQFGPSGLADLNGDGVRDLVMWLPRDGGRELDREGQYELRAINGHDGTALWPPVTLPIERQWLVWPRPTVGDLAGDGRPAVVVGVHGYGKQITPVNNRVYVIDGRTGKIRWSWAWLGDLEPVPPLLVDLEGTGRRSVCVVARKEDKSEVIVLDAGGAVRQRIPLEQSEWTHENFVAWWGQADVNGDGAEKLLFVNDGQLWACRGSAQDVLWKWPLPQDRPHPGASGRLLEVRSSGKGRPAEIVVWVGYTVYGLAGDTGRPRWRCNVPWSLAPASSEQPQLHVLSANDPGGLPRLLCTLPMQRDESARWDLSRLLWTDDFFTVARQPWPTTVAGICQPPSPAPRAYPVAEPESARSSPWEEKPPVRRILPPIFGALLGGSFLLCCSRRWRLAVYLLIGSGLAALVIGGVGFLVDSYFRTEERPYSWDGWDGLGFFGLCSIVGGVVLRVVVPISARLISGVFHRVRVTQREPETTAAAPERGG